MPIVTFTPSWPVMCWQPAACTSIHNVLPLVGVAVWSQSFFMVVD